MTDEPDWAEDLGDDDPASDSEPSDAPLPDWADDADDDPNNEEEQA